MSHRDGVFDPGLQPERTGLAWFRTALALAVGSLVALRVLPPAGGAWWLVPGLAGLGIAVGVLVLAYRRYRRIHRTLTGPAPGHVAGGGIVVGTAAATVLLALSALAFVLLR